MLMFSSDQEPSGYINEVSLLFWIAGIFFVMHFSFKYMGVRGDV